MAWREKYGKGYRVCWRNPDGSRGSKSGFSLAKDADAFKLEVERRELLGEMYTARDMTFGEFAGLQIENDRVVVIDTGPETWFGRYKREVSPGSYARRRTSAKHLEELVSLTFPRVTPDLLDELYVKVSFDHPRTAMILSQTVKLILRAAKVRGQRVNAEAIEVKAPSHKSRRGTFLTPGEVSRLAEAAESEDDEGRRDPQLANLIRFMAMTGLRIGEALSLTDDDVLTGAVIVRNSKTDSGVRQVPLTRESRVILDKQRLMRPAGARHVFPSPTGCKAHLSHTNARLKRVRSRVPGLEHVTFHAFRHTFASVLIAQGVHMKQMAELLGHNGTRMIEKVYGHLYPNSAASAMEGFDQAWGSLG